MVCGSAESAAQIVVLVPERAGQLAAEGEAGHHAKWRALTEDEETAAATEFRALAGGLPG